MSKLSFASLLAATALITSVSTSFAGTAPQLGVINIGVSPARNLTTTVNVQEAGRYVILVQGMRGQCSTDVELVAGQNVRELPDCAAVHSLGGTLTVAVIDVNNMQIGTGFARTGSGEIKRSVATTRGGEKRVAVLTDDDRAQLELARLDSSN